MKARLRVQKGEEYSTITQEQKEVEEFLNDSGKRINQREQSPQMSAVFFVPKKDMKKRMVQDYHYLNAWTIRNNYPLL